MECWRTHPRLSLLFNRAHYTRLGTDCSVVSNRDVTGNSHLAGDDAVLADLGRSRDSGLSGHYGIRTDLDVMGNLTEIIDLCTLADYGGAHLRLVNADIGADLHRNPQGCKDR